MKINELKQKQSKLKDVLGFDPMEIQQQSDAWDKMKLGVISASKAKELLAKPTSQTYKTYIADLVAQVATGMRHSVGANSLAWGNDHEDAARSAYEFYFKVKIVELPFIYSDNKMRYGCSPDGLVIEDDNILKGFEIKSPYNSTNYIKFVCNGNIKKEHELQCQFSMFVTGLDTWDYCNYDPRVEKHQLHFYRYERDEKLMSEIKERIDMAVNDIDKMLDILGMSFGEQWV